MFYVVEEREDSGKWVAANATEYRSLPQAERDYRLRRALFGTTPQCRFRLAQDKPNGLEWEKP